MNRTAMCLLCALLLSGAARQMAAAQIQFDNVNGHYLAQVYAAVQTGGVSTRYNGYDNNYGILPIGNANFGRPSGPQLGPRAITMGLRLEF